jgi:hypothetical protein
MQRGRECCGLNRHCRLEVAKVAIDSKLSVARVRMHNTGRRIPRLQESARCLECVSNTIRIERGDEMTRFTAESSYSHERT